MSWIADVAQVLAAGATAYAAFAAMKSAKFSEKSSEFSEKVLDANLKELRLTVFRNYCEKFDEKYAHIDFHLGRGEQANAVTAIAELLGLFSQELFMYENGLIDNDLRKEWEAGIKSTTRKHQVEFEKVFKRSQIVLGPMFNDYYQKILDELMGKK